MFIDDESDKTLAHIHQTYQTQINENKLQMLAFLLISFMVENGLAITRRFDSDVFEYGQKDKR